MRQLGLEIVKTFQNYREDIFFVAVMIMVLVVFFELYEIDMFQTGGKKHVNVVTIEGMKNKKKKRAKGANKNIEARKFKRNKAEKAKRAKQEGFLNLSSLVKESSVVEGLDDGCLAGTPAAEINQVAQHGPNALRLGSELRSARNQINNVWQEAMCRTNDPAALNEECLKLSSDNQYHCNQTNCCVNVYFSDKGKKRCVAGDEVGPIFSSLTETIGSGDDARTIEFNFDRDKDYYYHKGKCYGAACDNV